MKKHSIYIYIATLLGTLLLLGSCQQERLHVQEVPRVEQGTEGTKAGSEAETSGPLATILPGQVIVKLTPQELQGLRSMGNLSGEATLRSTSAEAQQALREIGATKMEPYFLDYDAYRTRRHKAGLDRWMLVTFEGELSALQAQQVLQGTDAFEYVEVQYATALPEEASEPLSEAELASLRSGSSEGFNDPLLPLQWHYFNTGAATMPQARAGADINLFEAWQVETGKPEVVVCVVDAGIDYQHKDLAGRVDLDRSYSFVFDSKTKKHKGYGQIESKSSAHGTHVAGTIAAINNNGIGVAGIAGGNGEEGTGITLINAQIFGAKGERTAPGIQGIVYGADHGAVISQNSWGYILPGPASLSQVDKEAMDYFITYAGCDAEGNQLPDSPMKGGVIIFAAGNDGLDYNSYPGAYEGCISVSSYGWGFQRASYSNYGTWVDIAAPGGDQRFGRDAGVLSTYPDNKYGYMQGTSMACPHVSGVAALIVSKLGKQGFTNAMLRERLLTALRPYDIYSLNNPLLKGKLGSGYIDASVALLEDGGKAPEAVTNVQTEASYISTLFSWMPAKDADATSGFAYYYLLHLGTSEITSSDKAAKSLKVYADRIGGTPDARVTYLATGLQDGTTYYYAIEAVDYFGHKSPKLITGSFQTLKNQAPTITEGLPKEPLKLADNQVAKLTLKVADPDGHKWDYSLKGDLYGVKHQRQGDAIQLEIQPIKQAGTHQFTILLSDEYGKSAQATLSYIIQKYQPVALAKSLKELSIFLDEKAHTIALEPLFQKQEGATLTFTAKSESPERLTVTLKGDQLTLQPKAKGRAIIQVTATDGITSAKVALQVLVK